MSAILLTTINAKWIHPSLALRLLKANLGELGKNCEIIEFALRQPLNEKTEPILAARPRILGISVSVWNHQATLELLKTLGEKRKNEQEFSQKPLVVLGGPEVSYLNKDAEIFRYADYVIRGEGEESFRSLCAEILGKNSGGGRTIFIDSGAAVDLNAIVSPYSLYTDEDLTRKLVYVEASRGCPFGCEFCQAPGRERASLGYQASSLRHETKKNVREFPLKPFLEDMGRLIDRGARTFKFLDRTFNLNMDRVKEIMEFFLERIKAPEAKITAMAGKTESEKSRPLCVHFEMVPFHFPGELKDLIRRFPPETLRLELGIQTFNPQTAALINLAGNREEEIENLKFLGRETNAILHVDLIAGLPGEDLASFGEGFDLLWRTLSETNGLDSYAEKSFEIQMGILKYLPGTPIIRHNETFRMIYAPCPPYEVIETGAMPKNDLDRVKNFARFWELIFNRRPFPDLLPGLLPAGKPVFKKFMLLSDRLLEYFGRNWGIDRQNLKNYLAALQPEKDL